MTDDWKQAWQPVIEAVGTDFLPGEAPWGADEVEKGTIRRFLEPLEFDCPLHYDREVATAYGYSDIIAPFSSYFTWTLPPIWRPGRRVFTSAERNAQPENSPIEHSALTGVQVPFAPPTTGYFATNLEIDYLQPVVVGDRLRWVGCKLLSCVPKETSVGRGAFMIWESEIHNQRGEAVARVHTGTYSYTPHPDQGG